MLQQTQVGRVTEVWKSFIGRYPTPRAMADVEAGDVIRAWGRLGYPRRARRLWESARIIAEHGWPDDLTTLPGVGRYTAGAIAVQAWNVDAPAVDVNIRRVVERVAGRGLTDGEADREQARVTAPARSLEPRDRFLALMDLGALMCRKRAPSCRGCPLRRRCVTRGVRTDEARSRQGTFEGSFRQRRGVVLATLREGPAEAERLDAEALDSLVADRLAVLVGSSARLP